MTLAEAVAGWLAGDVEEDALVARLRAGGFAEQDARELTDVLVGTGERLDLSALGAATVDKHSTGGVGDTTTLLVAPLLAAAGAVVVKLSGRGLGHTGGTIDKLEAIPGLRTGLAPEELMDVARRVGCAIGSQTDRLVPGDRALYALRHATGTAGDVALIASSVMAKKIAAGAGTIVVDVKTGGGALVPARADATALARLCVGIGARAGRRCVALVTAMDEPLGRAIGSALEVREAVELLHASPAGRLATVALELAAEALAQVRGTHAAAVREELVGRWGAGEALERLTAMVAAQGGDPRVCERPGAALPAAPHTVEVGAERDGWVAALPARELGQLAAHLAASAGAGGAAMGLVLGVSVGARVERGQPLATVHAPGEAAAVEAAAALRDTVEVDDEPVDTGDLVLDRLRSG